MRERDIQYSYSFKTNARGTLRERLGMALRDLADRIDSRQSLAVDMVSMPALSTYERLDAMRQGLKHMKFMQSEMVKLRAIEAGAKELSPDLGWD